MNVENATTLPRAMSTATPVGLSTGKRLRCLNVSTHAGACSASRAGSTTSTSFESRQATYICLPSPATARGTMHSVFRSKHFLSTGPLRYAFASFSPASSRRATNGTCVLNVVDSTEPYPVGMRSLPSAVITSVSGRRTSLPIDGDVGEAAHSPTSHDGPRV